VNGKTGLICRFIGTQIDLELLSISELVDRSKAFQNHGHLEALDSSSMSSNGPVKYSANDAVEEAMPR
jgi:hypothetical protein